MTPVKPRGLVFEPSVIYCGDCLEELKRLPDCCIDRDFRKELEYIRMLGGG